MYQREVRRFLGLVAAYGGNCHEQRQGGSGTMVTIVLIGQEEHPYLVIDNLNRNTMLSCYLPVTLQGTDEYKLEEVFLRRRGCLAIIPVSITSSRRLPDF